MMHMVKNSKDFEFRKFCQKNLAYFDRSLISFMREEQIEKFKIEMFEISISI